MIIVQPILFMEHTVVYLMCGLFHDSKEVRDNSWMSTPFFLIFDKGIDDDNLLTRGFVGKYRCR